MPKQTVGNSNEAIAARIKAGLDHFGYLSARGGMSDFAERYLGKRTRVSMVSNWLRGKDPPGRKTAVRFCEDWGCTIDWLLEGRAPAPPWFEPGSPVVREQGKMFSRQRRANDDKTALRIALESILLATLGGSRSAAKAFLDELETRAEASGFSSSYALLGALTDIAEEVRDGLRKDVPVRRKADPA